MTAAPEREAVFHVRHTTEYSYPEQVAGSVHDATLVLRETPRQRVHYSRITVEPEPRSLTTRRDYFGNHLTRFITETAQNRLHVDAESEVALGQGPPPETGDALPLVALRRQMHRARTPADLSALEFVFDSQYVPRSGRLAAWADPVFGESGGFLAGVAGLMHRIHREFRYDAAVTEISTPVEEVLERKEGVCQDFAHLMIGCLRSLGIPARYVSGYLVPLPGVLGAQASHAWVSVYAPGPGWVDFDPTNDVMPSGGHITVAWGRDYGDVSPLRGVIFGGGEHTLRVEVSVGRIR